MIAIVLLLLLTLVASLTPTCSVLDFGAKGDNKTEDTTSVQQAIDSCITVVFPSPRTYLLRPVKLDAHDNLTLLIEPGATLSAWPEPDTWNATTGAFRPLLYSDGYRACPNTSIPTSTGGSPPAPPHLCPAPLRHLSILGGGVIDGQGWRWWPYLKTRPRPILLELSRAEHLLLTNVTLLNSPSFHVSVRGSDMELPHINVSAGGCEGWAQAPNTDALNIGGQRIHVHDCFVHNGDDCVPTNVGWNNSDTEDVLVERVWCECGTNGGVPIIAGSASIRNVMYKDMVVKDTNQGGGAKISEAYDSPTGAFVNISWVNLTVINPRYAALYTNVFQEDSARAQCTPPPPNASRPLNWLTATNLSFIGVRAAVNSSSGAYAGCFLCSPTNPCRGLRFEDVVVSELGQEAGAHTPTPPLSHYTCDNVAEFTTSASSPPPCKS